MGLAELVIIVAGALLSIRVQSLMGYKDAAALTNTARTALRKKASIVEVMANICIEFGLILGQLTRERTVEMPFACWDRHI